MKKAVVIATSAALLAGIHGGIGTRQATAAEMPKVQAQALKQDVRNVLADPVQAGSQSQTSVFDLFGSPKLEAYNLQFKMNPANIQTITNNGGKYASSVIGNAIDGDMNTHWETGKPNSATFTNEVVVQLKETATLDRIVYAARQTGAKGKGFAKSFEIYGSASDDGNDFNLVTTGEYLGSTGDVVEIKFTPTAFKRIKFVFKKANEDWASAAEFGFYKADPVREAMNSLFTDGTMSEVTPGYRSTERLEELEKSAQSHPLYESEYSASLQLAESIVSGQANLQDYIVTAEQRGDMKKHASENLRMGFGTNNQPTGFAALPGQTVNVYVDAQAKGKMPSLVFSQQEGSWNSWARGVALHPGKNTIVVPEAQANSSYAHTVTKGGPVYIVNPYTPAEQGQAPRIRFEGLQRIPLMTKDTDPAAFKAFVAEYKQKLDADKAAHPNVQDRQLIDVAEMVSDHVIFTGTATIAYNQYVTHEIDPQSTLSGYDLWMNRNFTFYGMDGRSLRHDPKQIRENIRLMQPYGYMYAAGDHTGIQMDAVPLMMSDFKKNYPGWGLTHEIGHRMAVGEREYGEITNNMLSMLMSVSYHSLDNRIPFESMYSYVIQENKAVMDQRSLSERLGTYWQLELAHPGYWAELNSLYRERRVSLANGDNSKQQYLIQFSSEVLGMDLSSFFARHGFTVNPETKAATSVYPASPKLWYLNNGIVGYEGNGIEDVNAAVTLQTAVSAANKTNTLRMGVDKAYANDLLGYEIYRNGELIGFTGTNQFVDANVDPSVNYTYTIIAYDKKLKALKPVEAKAFAPKLSIEDRITLKLNQPFDPRNYVKAIEYTGKDLTGSVTVKNNSVDVTQKGEYTVTYEVKSEGTTVSRTTHVSVVSDYAYLSDLQAVKATVGWKELVKDKAPSGSAITLLRQGQPAVYAKGLGTHANSEVTYSIDGLGYDQFEAYVGIDQAVKDSKASGTFEVYVDGIKRWESGVMRAGTDHAYMNVPIAGAKELKLVTTDANENGNSSDHTVWADAKLTKQSSKPVLTLPESRSFVKLGEAFDAMNGIAAKDAEDGDLTTQVKVEADRLDVGKTGTYQVVYSVTDQDGNTVSETREVVVYSASTYISDLNWSSATTDYNVVRKDKASSGGALKLLVNGETKDFAKGIGTHANSEIVYSLAGTRAEYFEAYVGVDRNIPEQTHSSVIFRILADGQEVYNSGMMNYGTSAKLVRIPVAGVQELRLIADNGGNGNASDHADFADAKLLVLNSSPSLVIPPSVSTEVGQAIDLNGSYSAMDAEDGDLTGQVQISGLDRVDFNRKGEYQVTYTVTDSDGNTTTEVRSIAVVDMADVRYLTDLDWTFTQISYTAPRKDVSISGNALRLTDGNNREVRYDRGIGAHANSTIVYGLSGLHAAYFTSYVGVDRQMYGTVGSIRFEVYVDGAKKYDSGVMNSRDPQKFAKVDINGAQELKLVVTDGGNGNGSDHGTWGDAKLHLIGESESVLDTSLLVAVIEEAKSVAAGDYTPESIKALQVNVQQAEQMLAGNAATQEQIHEAVSSVRQAIQGLVAQDLTQPVAIKDDYLKKSIQKTLGITNEPTLGDMLKLTKLTCDSGRVTSLQGLEAAVHLQSLDIRGNAVTDFSILSGLPELTDLSADPQIVEVGELQGPVARIDNPVVGRDGNKVIPFAAAAVSNPLNKDLTLDITEWAEHPDTFTIDLSQEEKGYYMLTLAYKVEGNLVQLIYMVSNK